jgi:hypothetical protein
MRTEITCLLARAFAWEATFTDLRLAGITLDEWLAFHRARRRLAA